MKNIFQEIEQAFCGRVKITERRKDIYQLYLPIYHEDGDMVDVYLDMQDKKQVMLSDFGQTLMRLSYHYDINTSKKEDIFLKMVAENGLQEDDGKLFMAVKMGRLFEDIHQFTATCMKIGSMKYFEKSVLRSLFYEELEDFIETEFKDLNLKKKTTPLENRDDLEVDYELQPNGRPIYLFGVKDANKARLTAISCLEFEKAHLPFRSIVVHEDFSNLSKKDASILTNNCDKQFTSLPEFKNRGKQYLLR